MPVQTPLLHLDTNFLIGWLAHDPHEELAMQEWTSGGGAIAVSAVTWSEYLCGPLRPGEEALARSFFPKAEPLTRADAERAAHLFNATGRRSRSLADCQIAAVALRCGATVATSNRADFAPFAPFGLQLLSVP